MQRRQRDALHHRRVPGVGAHPKLGQQPREVQLRALGDFVVHQFGQRAQGFPALAGAGTDRLLGRQAQRFQHRADDVGQGTLRTARRGSF